MQPDDIATYPATPPGIAEWEDLLVRVELMPRALRTTLERARPSDSQVPILLSEMLAFEEWVRPALHALRDSDTIPEFPDAYGYSVVGLNGTALLESMFDHLSSLRTKNFVQVQRRGIDAGESAW